MARSDFNQRNFLKHRVLLRIFGKGKDSQFVRIGCGAVEQIIASLIILEDFDGTIMTHNKRALKKSITEDTICFNGYYLRKRLLVRGFLTEYWSRRKENR